MPDIRVEFDSTLEEVVDVHILLATNTETYRRQRQNSQILVGGCLAALLLVISLRSVVDPSGLLMAAILAGCAGFAIVTGLLYGRWYDSYVRRHHRDMVRELLRNANQVHCMAEVREDALWTKVDDTEITFNWRRLKRLNETAGSIELWFDPGIAVIRDRAFASPVDRQRFMDAIRDRVRVSAVFE
jgi:hypothetical protein